MAVSRLLSSGVTSHSSIDRCQHFGGTYVYREERVGTKSIMASCSRSFAFLIMFEQTDAIVLHVGYEVLTAVVVMITDFCDVVLYNPDEVHQCYKNGMYFQNVGELLQATCCCFVEVSTLHCIT